MSKSFANFHNENKEYIFEVNALKLKDIGSQDPNKYIFGSYTEDGLLCKHEKAFSKESPTPKIKLENGTMLYKIARWRLFKGFTIKSDVTNIKSITLYTLGTSLDKVLELIEFEKDKLISFYNTPLFTGGMPYYELILIARLNDPKVETEIKIEVENIVLKDYPTDNLLKISMEYGLENLTC